MPGPEPPYIAISRQKQSRLTNALNPDAESWQQLHLPPHLIPPGMRLSVQESIYDVTPRLRPHGRLNVMDVPRTCGLLSPRDQEITENYDVKGLLDAIARGEMAAEEAVRAFCKRAAISHQLTRCLSEPLFDSALQRAKDLDNHYNRTGTTVGPLHGLPISLKDTFKIKGIDTTIGFTALASHPATENAALYDLLTTLGAVVITKTNVPQTLSAMDSCNHLFGRTLNPHNHLLSAGGSSGGEGVLVAMRGSMVGFGSDIGGSIRVPAMCNGIYGFKPSEGRVPYGGQEDAQIAGKGEMALRAVAGPLARSVRDLGVVMGEIVPRAEMFGEDCIPGRWVSESAGAGAGASTTPAPAPHTETKTNLTVGIIRSDGLVNPLPPIAKLLDEVAHTLRQTPGIEVIDLPTPPALSKCQTLAGKLMVADDGSRTTNILNATAEPLTPWISKSSRKSTPSTRTAPTVSQLAELQAQRSAVRQEMLKMWTWNADAEPAATTTGESKTKTKTGDRDRSRSRRIDCIVLPVAPHPVAEIDRYNAIGYTSSLVLLDYPAGVIPVRRVESSDLELGKEMTTPVLGRWDQGNRELWNENSVDRRVYLDSHLCIQVATPRLHDYDLFRSMEIIDNAVRVRQNATSAKL